MGTSGRLATTLDVDMLCDSILLRDIVPGGIFPAFTRLHEMKSTIGAKGIMGLADILGRRRLLRYITSQRANQRSFATREVTYVAVTPFSPEEASVWLALPAPQTLRTHVVLLDPRTLEVGGRPIFGPRYAKGGGIEFILERGFHDDAVVNISPDSESKWPLEVN